MINKILKFLIITFWLLQIPLKVHGRHQNRNGGSGGGGGGGGGGRRYRSSQLQQLSNIDVRDKILELQCYAKCQETVKNMADYKPCLKKCQNDMIKEPRRGYCPVMQNAIFQNINVQPLQKLSCLDNCSYDFDCPEVQKCCNSACGPVCMQPIGVRDDSLLPPIPKISKCSLMPREQKVEITILSNSTFNFLVEVRYHIGLVFSARKLGPWQYQHVEKLAEMLRSNSMFTTVGFHLKPGRYYQVRVAAINAFGFRGYSEPSQEFALPNHPKPPKAPADLKIVSSKYVGNYVSIKIVWCASKSNLPIEKYKIIWSLYVNERDQSYISNEAFVKDRHQFEIPNLLPDSSYYIQVQAMSINGRRRLKSDKHSLLYNTTIVTTQAFSPLKCGKEQQITRDGGLNNAFNDERFYSKKHTLNDDTTILTSASLTNNGTYITRSEQFDVKYRPSRKLGMLVIISGFDPKEQKIYELCPIETNCGGGEYNAIRVNKDSLVFSKLSYNTTYNFKPRSNSVTTEDTMKGITFTTPKCENFRKGHPKANIKC